MRALGAALTAAARLYLCVLLLLAALLARRIARVALRLLLGLERGLPLGSFFRLARKPCGFRRRSLFLSALLFGLGGLTLQADLFAASGDGLALLTPFHDFGIIRSRLSAEFLQKALPRVLRRLLPIGKSGLLESSHRTSSSSDPMLVWGLIPVK